MFKFTSKFQCTIKNTWNHSDSLYWQVCITVLLNICPSFCLSGVNAISMLLSVCMWTATYSVNVNTTRPDRTASAAKKDSKPRPGNQDHIYQHPTDPPTHVSQIHRKILLPYANCYKKHLNTHTHTQKQRKIINCRYKMVMNATAL